MESLRQRCLALPEPYQAAALAMWKEAQATLERYPGVQTAEQQVKFELGTEVTSFEFVVAQQNEEG